MTRKQQAPPRQTAEQTPSQPPKQTPKTPHPALTLRHTLRGHMGSVFKMALSPDGRTLASPSQDSTVRLWAVASGRCLQTLAHQEAVVCVGWSTDGATLATGADDNKVYLWDAATGQRMRMLAGHGDMVNDIAWSPDGTCLAFCSEEDQTIRLWEAGSERVLRELRGHTGSVASIAWSPDGRRLCSGAWDGTVKLWNAETGEAIRTLQGYERTVWSAAWSPNGHYIASGSSGKTVRIRDADTGQEQYVLEGHTADVVSVSFLDDGRLLASLDYDGAVIFWRTDTWAEALRLEKIGEVHDLISNLAVHPTLPVMAAPGPSDSEINLWALDFARLRGAEAATSSVFYVNAKAVLLGESGVGKSGLGIRMAERKFRKTESTHGAQFWHFPTEQLPGLPANVQAELTLWDLAGQPEYRLTHQLFLDDTDAALLLFDCSDAADPFRGVPYWAKALKKHAPEAKKLLVSARCDVSPVTVHEQEINRTLAEYGLDRYFTTCAHTGAGVEALFAHLMEAIAWEQLPRTSTPKLFQVIREFLLEQKQKIVDRKPGQTDRQASKVDLHPGDVGLHPGDGNPLSSTGSLLSMAAIRTASEERFTERAIKPEELDTVVSLLQSRGLVYRLEPRPGVAWILLRPELINQYGASIIQAARNHPDGIGAVAERDVLTGAIVFTGFERLPRAEEAIVLESTAELLIRHDLCFREMGYLVFPSQINVARPAPDNSASTTNALKGAFAHPTGPPSPLPDAIPRRSAKTPLFLQGTQLPKNW